MEGFFTDPTDAIAMSPAFTLPKVSDEQKAAIRHLVSGNVIIESVAGSGKTTTVLYIAKVFAKRRILLLTYNAKLKLETRDKVDALGIDNLEVHSYHSFCVKNIGMSCVTDAGIIAYVEASRGHDFKPGDFPADDGFSDDCFSTTTGFSGDGFSDETATDLSNIELPQYDMIILDEAQDMTFVYYELVLRILEQSPKAYICVLGDQFQSIYVFNNADHRFITLADKVITNDYEWNRTRLSTSYRVTNQIANFINKCAFGYEQMLAAKDGKLPRYLFSNHSMVGVLHEVKYYLTTYDIGDIFILAPSLRSSARSPVTRLSNMLSKDGIPVYMPSDDGKKLDDSVLKNKLVFSTFHQAKGLERKAVIVLGFDMGYYTYFNKRALPNSCPNEMYVAITRASECLTVVHNVTSDFLPFLAVENLDTTCVTVGQIGIPTDASGDDRGVRVTDLVRHVSPDVMSVLTSLLTVEVINPPGDHINIPSISAQVNPLGDTLHEDVSDITGTAIPAYYHYKSTGIMDLLSIIPAKDRKPLQLPIKSPGQLLEIANRYTCERSRRLFKLNQIHTYDWLTQENLDACVDRLTPRIPAGSKMEVGYKLTISGKAISGFIDMVSPETIWEIKSMDALNDEHILQIAIYALMHQVATGIDTIKYYLYNVTTDELCQITADKSKLIKLARALVHYKYHNTTSMDDGEFLRKVANIRGDTIEVPRIQCDLCNTSKDLPITSVSITTTRKKPIVPKKPAAKRKPAVKRKPAAKKPATTKAPIVVKKPTVAKKPIVAKRPTAAKKPIVTKGE